MNIDKIRCYIGDYLFSYWVNVKNREAIQRAAGQLKKELDSGVLNGVKYTAELQLLNYLLN